MHELSAITHDTDMTTGHAQGTDDQNVPCLHNPQRITSIPLKPNLLDLRCRCGRIGIKVNAPAFPVQIPE